MVDDRESQSMRQAFANARILRGGLRATEPDVPRILQTVQVPNDGGVMLRLRGQWFVSTVDLTKNVLPPDLVEVAGDRHAGRQTLRVRDTAFVATAVPIIELDAVYFEMTPIDDVEDTLELLSQSLIVAGIAATIAGGAIGALTSGAVLRPVRKMANVAREIVDGDLESRLDAEGDPDLEPLVSSFNEMLDDLRDRIQREARFASDVTHELRGPLATLSAAVDVVNRRREQLPETAVKAVDALARQVTAFNQLVLDLLEISRFDAGAAQLEARSLDLRAFTERVVTEAGCSVPVSAEAGLDYTITADPRRLQQMLVNLLQNAERYAGGATEVAVTGDDGVVRVSVADAGPGVPVDERDVIFGRFSRGSLADRPDAPRGTGLGLALVSEHALLHHGRVWVEDAGAGGARFVIELPREQL
jgi:two-component system, OmpR family, sensor histidine kinase MtrB